MPNNNCKRNIIPQLELKGPLIVALLALMLAMAGYQSLVLLSPRV